MVIVKDMKAVILNYLESITTPTPNASTASNIALAISFVNLSWT